jgi:hypothetical protein
MEITIKITVNTEGASAEQLEYLPAEILRVVENCVTEWLPNSRTELVNKEA